MKKKFRKGAVGALMDEYERAAAEYRNLIQKLTEDEFTRLADAETADVDCRSILAVTRHVIQAGYAYADYLREQFSIPKEPVLLEKISLADAARELDKMLDYTARTLDEKWEMSDEEICRTVIRARWGSVYDLEQLLEHAIVHVLRHRRQVEKFLLKFENEDFGR